MKKILFISYDGMTDPLGQSQVLPYLAGLSKEGYQFTILSFEKPARFAKEKNIIETIVNNAGIRWVPLSFTKHPPILSKIYDRWRLKRKAVELFKKERFDMIHCRSYIAAEVGLQLKKKYGTKFFFDMRGFWADEKVDGGQWNQDSFFFRKVYRHYKQKEQEFLLHADGIISLTEAARKELLSKKPYASLLIDVIPCCADLDHFNYQQVAPGTKEALRSTLGIGAGNKIITYLGSIGGWYMTHEMFAFFKQLLLRYPDFVMLVMTKDDAELVKQQAAKEGIPAGKIIVAYAGRKELPAYVALSDCSIFFIRPTYSKMASSPTKHAELMGMGVPVICNHIGDTGTVIQETKTGIVVNEFSDAAYTEAIDQVDALLQIPKEHIRQSAFRYFDLVEGITRYLQVYKRIFAD